MGSSTKNANTKVLTLINNQYKEFEEAYNKQTSSFLLLQLANANENTHTRILKYLLSIQNNNGEYYILKSFLQFFGLPELKVFNTISDQKQAVGSKKTGFIDLYIEYNNGIKIIIENKIKDAGDTDQQLARYIYTAATGNRDPNTFNEWYKQWKESDQRNKEVDLSNIYVLYLTREGGSPSGYSLPEELKEQLGNRYIECNYMDDLSEWFDNILPTLPIGMNHSISTGMHQYMLYLESLRNPTKKINIELLKEITNKNSLKDNEIYENIGEYIKKNKDKDAAWIAYLEKERENIYAQDINDLPEWRLHVTPSFIILYKKSWADLDTRKYTIPSLNLCLPIKMDCNNNSKIQWKLQVEHVSPNRRDRENSRKMPDKIYTALLKNLTDTTNPAGHDNKTTILMKQIDSSEEWRSYFTFDRVNRKKMYNDLVNDDKLVELIKDIDTVVNSLGTNKESTPQ